MEELKERMQNLIENSEMVYCPICNNNKPMKQITHKHLKLHSLTIEEFKQKYPGCFLTNPIREEKAKEARRQGKQKIENTVVIKQCWNFESCGHEVSVNINVGNRNVTCNDCKNKGLFHPDFLKDKQRVSQLAQTINKDRTIIDKRTKSLLERSPEEINNFKIKRENTLKEKDGDDWKQVQLEKTKAGMLKTYGKEFAFKIPEFKQKASNTLFERSGFYTSMENPDNVRKVREKLLPKQKEITERTIQTNIQKYGGRGPTCSPLVIAKMQKTHMQRFVPKLKIFLEKVQLEIIGEYIDAYAYNNYKCLKCSSIFSSNWNQIQQGRLCPSCQNKFKPSRAEDEIYEYLSSLGISNILRNDRVLIKPYEIDILLPDQKICIEHSGLYTHSNKVLQNTRKGMDDLTFYHIYKYDECKNKGYQLLTIFEDEWMFKQDIVKSMLKQRVGLNNNPQIYARDCEIREIKKDIKRDFLKKFHIQGNDNSSIRLGAFTKENDVLVAVMTFSHPSRAKGVRIKKDGQWELNRFCTDSNFRVPGIAGKLLEHFKRNYEWKEIFSYADRRWSEGNLYHKLGFTLVSNLTKIIPNYWYIDCNKLIRIHRYALRKTKNDDPILTEKMSRIIQGYERIYDCGNLKFVLNK